MRCRATWTRPGRPTPDAPLMARLRPPVAALAVALCFAAGVAALGIRALSSDSPKSYTTTITVDSAAKSYGGLGSGYIGLSIESDTLNSGKITSTSDLVRLLQNLGRSVLRFGGNSVDRSFNGISPAALHRLAALANASGWSVLYTENEGEYNAARVTTDASAVSAALGAKLFAFACGNEPDVYRHNGLRSHDYSVGAYLNQAADCLRDVKAAAPQAPLEGPDTAGNRDWFSTYARREAGTVSWLGQHYYPMGCTNSGDRPAALVTTLLSPGLAAKEAATLNWYVAAAKTAGVPLLITETNSACGGGIPGLSDAYASALWAVDYSLTGAEQGVRGMYFHTGGLDSSCAGYAVLCQTGTNSYRAQPIYYGLLFAHLLGTGQFLPVKVSMSSRAGNLAAFALRSPTGGLRLMVENLSGDQADAMLHAGDESGSATVLSLTGPGPLATSGVQIQGASVAANGTFNPGTPNTVQGSPQGCPVTLAPYSAALITIS
jgi:hypothetical protein